MKQFVIVAISLVVVLSTSASAVQAQDITAEGRAQGRQDRIEQYKQAVTDRLSQAEQRRIAGVCKVAQINVDRLQSTLNTVLENRQRTYSELADTLALVSDQLEIATIDTTLLDTYISQMQKDAQKVVSSVAEYQLILNDLAVMDCEADVDGFQATLTVARTKRSDLKLSAQNVKVYVQETIKPELQSLRQQLADLKTTETQ